MPRDVDPRQRLADIAAATIRVARSEGTHAVTIRSVARELGGSTTLVTNYLPSRAALILNALDQGRDRWQQELAETLADLEPSAHLRAVTDWALSSTTDDPVLRTLILEIVANAAIEPVMAEALRHESTAFEAQLRTAAAASGFADPEAVADLAYLLIRGAYIASTEDPERWSDAHVREVIHSTIAAQPRA
ncbi:TetR/AcrR family transcriptional regulator [Demequina gelatinilytica]|uniref:TetR/AcrR family transcriptional regulator n=1 Tax=Demequina gelatinilytica TaxID=1638980 RepID=UPI000785B351|nr:TetR family transcriptional regulator C-terminal domain-containing protein [Demequina gelatinilytica]